MTIGDRIRVKREEAGLSQEELAKLTDTTKQAIYKYEKGIVVNIPLSRLEKLGKVLNCTPAYIMGWTEDETRELSPKEEKFIELVKNMSDDEIDKMNDYLSFILSKRK